MASCLTKNRLVFLATTHNKNNSKLHVPETGTCISVLCRTNFRSRTRKKRVLYLCLFEIWSLFTNNVGQKLVFQTFTCDREVDKGGLGLHLGFVMWVGQFGVKDEAEFWVILNFLVTHLDVPERQRVVQIFTHVRRRSWIQVLSGTEHTLVAIN